jgi:tetrahydromethanopterin S-methyltransferase subunit G
MGLSGGVGMEEKIFNLLEKLYIEMQAMKSNMATKDDIANMATKDDIANMATKDDIANMATKDDLANMVTKDDLARIGQRLVKLENKMDLNHKVLFDGYNQTYEKLEALEKKVDRIEKKVDSHDIEIKVIKSVANG